VSLLKYTVSDAVSAAPVRYRVVPMPEAVDAVNIDTLVESSIFTLALNPRKVAFAANQYGALS
jgi:hypothetical protein